METTDTTILDRLERLERLFDEVHLPPDSIVGAAYVARLFDCSPESVVCGRFGTDRIPRVRQRPVGFKKKDVDRVLKSLEPLTKEEAKNRAAKISGDAKKVRRKSMITKAA